MHRHPWTLVHTLVTMVNSPFKSPIASGSAVSFPVDSGEFRPPG